MVTGDITFFESPAHFRKWLSAHHSKATEVWVGFYKKDSGKANMTWPESVDEALCFGWIDGIRKSIDSCSYTIRFTPRKPHSIWSSINIRRVEELTRLKRMKAAGHKAFERRRENRSGIYSYENRPVDLPAPYQKRLKANPAAWSFFKAQPPGYRRQMTWRIVSAKKEETRLKRLQKLIEYSAQGRTLL